MEVWEEKHWNKTLTVQLVRPINPASITDKYVNHKTINSDNRRLTVRRNSTATPSGSYVERQDAVTLMFESDTKEVGKGV